MRRGTLPLLLFIIVLALGAAYVVFWPTKGKMASLPINGASQRALI